MTAVVRAEPRTYELWKDESFFADLVRARYGNEESLLRLKQHQAEIDVETRAASTTLTAGGEFSPPFWAIERFVTQARAGRVLADLVLDFPLPAGVSSVHIPKLKSAGADAEPQPNQGDAVTSVDETTTDESSTVVTVAGESDASLQLLDQTPAPGYDGIVYLDLTRAYNQTLEKQMLSGLGFAVGQLAGITQLSGRPSDIDGSGVSATQATGVPQLWPLLGKAAATVGNKQFLAPEAWLIAPRRWFWLASLTVALGNTAQPSPYPTLPSQDAGTFASSQGIPFLIQGLPAYPDGAIAAQSGTDFAVAVRPSDMILYESAPKFAVDTNALSGTLQVRLQLRRYAAFIVLHPSSYCVVSAIPAPTGF